MSHRNMNFNSTQHPPVVPPNVCPVCGEPMHRYYQPGIGSVSGSWQEHCLTPACALFYVTLEAGTHNHLTRAEIEAYAAMQIGIAS